MMDPTNLPAGWNTEMDGVYPHVFAFRIDDGPENFAHQHDPAGGESSAQAAARLGGSSQHAKDDPHATQHDTESNDGESLEPIASTAENSRSRPGQFNHPQHSPDRMETSEQSSDDEDPQYHAGTSEQFADDEKSSGPMEISDSSDNGKKSSDRAGTSDHFGDDEKSPDSSGDFIHNKAHLGKSKNQKGVGRDGRGGTGKGVGKGAERVL